MIRHRTQALKGCGASGVLAKFAKVLHEFREAGRGSGEGGGQPGTERPGETVEECEGLFEILARGCHALVDSAVATCSEGLALGFESSLGGFTIVGIAEGEELAASLSTFDAEKSSPLDRPKGSLQLRREGRHAVREQSVRVGAECSKPGADEDFAGDSCSDDAEGWAGGVADAVCAGCELGAPGEVVDFALPGPVTERFDGLLDGRAESFAPGNGFERAGEVVPAKVLGGAKSEGDGMGEADGFGVPGWLPKADDRLAGSEGVSRIAAGKGVKHAVAGFKMDDDVGFELAEQPRGVAGFGGGEGLEVAGAGDERAGNERHGGAGLGRAGGEADGDFVGACVEVLAVSIDESAASAQEAIDINDEIRHVRGEALDDFDDDLGSGELGPDDLTGVFCPVGDAFAGNEDDDLGLPNAGGAERPGWLVVFERVAIANGCEKYAGHQSDFGVLVRGRQLVRNCRVR